MSLWKLNVSRMTKALVIFACSFAIFFITTGQVQLGTWTNWTRKPGTLQQDNFNNWNRKAGPTQNPELPRNLQQNISTYGLDVIVAFPRMTDVAMAKIGGYSGYSQTKLRERDLEFIDSLRRNLQHPVVSRIHLFNDQPEYLAKMLRSEPGINFDKIKFVKSSKDVAHAELFRYASNFLQGRFVNVLNADIYLGEDFTRLDWFYLRRTRVMYSLTRKHMKPIPKGCGYNETTLLGYCEKGSRYKFDHDCYLFYVHSAIPDQLLRAIDYRYNALALDALIIWAFRTKWNFAVLNPCRVLSLHHNHCSNVRPPDAGKFRAWPDIWLTLGPSGQKLGHESFSNSIYIDSKGQRYENSSDPI